MSMDSQNNTPADGLGLLGSVPGITATVSGQAEESTSVAQGSDLLDNVFDITNELYLMMRDPATGRIVRRAALTEPVPEGPSAEEPEADEPEAVPSRSETSASETPEPKPAEKTEAADAAMNPQPEPSGEKEGE